MFEIRLEIRNLAHSQNGLSKLFFIIINYYCLLFTFVVFVCTSSWYLAVIYLYAVIYCVGVSKQNQIGSCNNRNIEFIISRYRKREFSSVAGGSVVLAMSQGMIDVFGSLRMTRITFAYCLCFIVISNSKSIIMYFFIIIEKYLQLNV